MADLRDGLREDVVDMSLDPDEDNVPWSVLKSLCTSRATASKALLATTRSSHSRCWESELSAEFGRRMSISHDWFRDCFLTVCEAANVNYRIVLVSSILCCHARLNERMTRYPSDQE